MNKVISIVALAVGLAGGWFGAAYLAGGTDGNDIRTDLRRQLDASEREVSELEGRLRDAVTKKAELEDELEAARKSALSAESSEGDWRALVAGLEQQKSELEERLAAAGGRREASAERAMELLNELKGKPLASFMNPIATSKLVGELRELGEAGVQGLVALLESDDKDDRAIAAQILGQLGDPASIDALREAAMNDDDEMVANLSARSLMLMESKDAIPALRDLAENSKHEGSRVNSMFGLLKQEADGSVELARKYLETDGSKHRHELAGGLFMLTGNKTVYPIVDRYYEEMSGKGGTQIGQLAVMYYGSIDTQAARERLVGIRDGDTFDETVRAAARSALDD